MWVCAAVNGIWFSGTHTQMLVSIIALAELFDHINYP